MKNKFSRHIFLFGVLLLLLVFLFPLWRITLYAPQYPDGITMYIWVNKISGNTESVLQNINILNHYIGMQYIEPDAIPELKIFPYIIIGMVALGIFFYFRNRKFGFLAWSVLLLLLGVAGIYDFYLWEYDYGHNLDPNAPIKIPGMAYQPPLFGRKMLLNFDAHSYPHWGSLFLGLSILFTLAAFFLRHKKILVFKKKAALAVACLILVGMVGCSTDPKPINYGEDNCSYCQMTIVDQRYGSEIVSNKGKLYKFDAIECMINYIKKDQISSQEIGHRMVTGYSNPGNLIDATQSWYLRSPQMPSPMGMYLTAFEDKTTAEEFHDKKGGDLYSWDQLFQQFGQLPSINMHH